MNITIENFIGIYENAFTKEYCDGVIEYFNNAEKAGLTLNRQQERTDISTLYKDDLQLAAHSEFCLRNSIEIIQKFTEVFWREVYSEYVKKYSILVSYGQHSSYAYKIQKTKVGQGYHMWHTESSNKECAGRILTWTLYLNDVEEGGETEFLYYPKRVKPKTGTLVLWPAGLTHVHRGNPPISNTKYIVTGWVEF
jgi:hypothetical protein